MRRSAIALAATVAWSALAAGCGNPPPSRSAVTTAKVASAAARITQFYATAPNMARGEQELVCYGVENARAVHLAPPEQELSAAVARCVEVTPTSTTRYTLTVDGFSGPPATGELTVTVGPPHAKIIDVTVSSLNVSAGSLVSLCYHVENAASVQIEPIHFRGPSTPRGCGTDAPRKTTSYTITAIGTEGSRDTEHVTVQVH